MFFILVVTKSLVLIIIVTSCSWTNETLFAAMKNHITNVVTQCRGQCYAWDVANEGTYTLVYTQTISN